MQSRYLQQTTVVVPFTFGAVMINDSFDVYNKHTNKCLEVIYDENGNGFVTLPTEIGPVVVKHNLLVALSFKRSRIPPSLWGKLNVLFMDSDETNIHPGNTVICFPDGGIEHPGLPNWFYVPGFTRYVANEAGEVINTDTMIPMSSYLAEVGYHMYGLTPDVGARTIVGIHRVLALAFKSFPANVDKLDVNHCDGIKTNNDLDNLEWATRKRNCDHAYSTGLRQDNCEVVVKSIYSGKEREFYSLEECARVLKGVGNTIRLRVMTDGQLAFRPGLLFKKKKSTTPWAVVENPNEALKRSGLSSEYDCVNTVTGVTRRFSSSAQIASFVGVKKATFCWRMTNQDNPNFGIFKVKLVDCHDDCESLFTET